MAGGRLLTLRTERDNLVDQLKNRKQPDKAKILVQIMDLDEDIDKLAEEEKQRRPRNFKFEVIKEIF